MAKFGEDVALSLGGALPGQAVNGLPEIYGRLLKETEAIPVVAMLEVDYVKVRNHGDKPDEPVLRLTRIEIPAGDDEQDVRHMLTRLRDARGGAQQTLDEAI